MFKVAMTLMFTVLAIIFGVENDKQEIIYIPPVTETPIVIPSLTPSATPTVEFWLHTSTPAPRPTFVPEPTATELPPPFVLTPATEQVPPWEITPTEVIPPWLIPTPTYTVPGFLEGG